MLSRLLRVSLLTVAHLALFAIAYRLSNGSSRTWSVRSSIIATIVVLHPLLCMQGAIRGGKRGLWTVIAHLFVLHWGWWFGYFVGGNGWRGILLISVPAILVFWAGLISFSLFVLPVQIREWNQAALTLIGFVTGHHCSYYRVKDEETRELASGKGTNPGLIINKAHTAVPLSTGKGFSRVAGPGITFIGRPERPRQNQVVDQRAQSRGDKVRATTRDGIDVEFSLSVTFRIEQRPPTRPPVTVTSYSESAVFNAIIAQRSAKSVELKWDEIPLELAKNHARTVVAEYLLDRLLEDEVQAQQRLSYDAMEPTAERRRHLWEEHTATMPREIIRAEIDKHLRAEIAGCRIVKDEQGKETEVPEPVRKVYGIKIIGVGLGNIEVAGAKIEDRKKALEKPETKEVKEAQERVQQAEKLRKDIMTQRAMNWQAEWMAESIRRRAQSEAEAAREIGRARAQSQMRMIQALTEGFEQAEAANLQGHTDVVVLLRVLDTIEAMAHEPGTREHLPAEALNTQAIIKRAVESAKH
jgi:regulator of protease activity HflC (stomatin/prohibitin superfamily)